MKISKVVSSVLMVLIGVSLVHYGIVSSQSTAVTIKQVITINAFFGFFALSILLAMIMVKKVDTHRVGLTYMAVNTIKILFAGLLFYFLIEDKNIESLLHFFIPYFIYTGVELYFGIKIIKTLAPKS